MIKAIHASLHPLKAMNRRVLIGGGGLTLLMLAECAIFLVVLNA